MKIVIVAGARPNFMKIAPIITAIKNAVKMGASIQYRLVHTGQHYDLKMSGTFFEELNIPLPDVDLGAGGGTQAEQTGAIMIAFEKELMNTPVDLGLVVGDVTSTLACAIVAKKLQTKVAHVEAGIRSFDLSMPEEINRMVTDSITDYFFTTTEWASENLRKVGIAQGRIFFVGNVMIDTLMANRSRFKKPIIFDALCLKEKQYFVLTLHRPGNVDDVEKLRALISTITESVRGLPVIFPTHPRTERIMNKFNIEALNLYAIEPMGYFEFNYLVEHSLAVITDSGGITEETTVLGIPCMTLRENTERPETVELGTNKLVGVDPCRINTAMNELFCGCWPKGNVPVLWDGGAATRIVKQLLDLNANGRL